MTLRTKLLLGFSGVIAFLVVPSLFAAVRLGSLRELAVEGRSGHAAAVAGLGQMQELLADLDRVERAYIATSDSTLGAAALATVDSLATTFSRFGNSSYVTLDTRLGSIIDDIAGRTRTIAEDLARGRVAEATVAFQALLSRFEDADAEIALLAGQIDGLARREFERADAMTESARVQTLVGLGAALLLTILLASMLTHTVATPLRRLSRGMARVADGEYETPDDLPYGRSDEIGDVSTSFRTMAQRLADLDRTKSEFFGVVSHELKTPLNVVRAYVELLEDECGQEASELERRLLTDIGDQVHGMARLVSRLMDISRLSAGTYRIAPEPVRVEDLVAELERTWSQRAVDEDVTFEIRLGAQLPEWVVMDVDIIRDEVLGNLISNAVRFSPEGGRVDVEVDAVEGGVAFTVTDCGPGIPDEHRELIFRKHYVVDRRALVGSGLGLAIAKEMVELHGGLIALAANSPGRGARFVVKLPLEPSTPELEVPALALIEGRPGAPAANAARPDSNVAPVLAAVSGQR